MDGEALSTLVVNKIRGLLNVVAVKAPGFGDRRKAMLEDMAVADRRPGRQRGGRPQAGLRRPGRARPGPPRGGHQGHHHASSTARASESEVSDRIRQLRTEIEDTDSDWDREKLQERVAKLAGGVAVLRAGAATEVELKEKKHRLEDAISATRAAIEEGIIPGGGSALVQAAAAARTTSGMTGDEATGVQRRAQRAVGARPGGSRRTRAPRAASSWRAIADLPAGHGYNAATGEYGDLVAQGVIDPVKVTRSAVQNAASIAGMLLTTEVLVTEKPEPEAAEAGGGHGHGHGH